MFCFKKNAFKSTFVRPAVMYYSQDSKIEVVFARRDGKGLFSDKEWFLV